MLEIIRNRRSVRRYLPKQVEPEKIHELLMAAFCAPTAKNLRQVEFVVVQEPVLLERLSLATPYSSFAKQAPLVIAICYDTSKARRFQEDCAMAAENIYLEVTAQGLGACYIQIADGTEAQAGPPEDYVRSLLGIPSDRRILCLMTVGYPEKMPEPHGDSEFDLSRVHHERFGSR